jgi:hypothetical protein
VNSSGTERFWSLYRALPFEVRRQAQNSYALFAQDPQHPGLQFKRVHPSRPYVSARIGANHRVIGVLEDEAVIWFWIGTHSHYDKILARL